MKNKPNSKRIRDYLFVLPQYLLPHHLLSWWMHALTRAESPRLKNWLIRTAIRHYRIDMTVAAEPDPRHYRSFNHFFTRALRPEARPLGDQSNAVLCPADGVLSQAGRIEQGNIFQAKGHQFALAELLGDARDWSTRFENGGFATVYLSPRDYHRVHMPLGGELKKMVHVPGRLFSVNPATTALVPRLFSRNERVICLFDTEAGAMAVILVGAIFVASIDTVWAGAVTPMHRRQNGPNSANADPTLLKRGQEMGRFNMGSTVIVLFGKNKVDWSNDFVTGRQVRMGETMGYARSKGNVST